MRVLFLSKKWLWCLCLSCLLLLLGGIIIPSAMSQTVKTLAPAECKPVYEVDTEKNQVAISFDASWGADYTLKLLDTLDEYQVGATFFLVTMWVEAYPEMTREIADRGYEIGLHSTTHPHFTQLTEEEIISELEQNFCAIVETASFFPVLFRPPFGDYNSEVTRIVRSCGYEVIQWSIDSLDWKDLSADEIYERVTKDIHAGDIVLFHNNGLHTAEALPRILDYLQQQGLEVVSISELLPAGNTTVDNNGILH